MTYEPVEQKYLWRVHNPEGYVSTFSLGSLYGPVYNYYRKDHPGNNREVWNASYKWGSATRPASTSQITQYYPSGLSWKCNTGDNPGTQPYKYGGKEFVEMHGLDEYDSDARWYYPAIMRTTTVDPLSEEYYSYSPYAYAMNNPVYYVDPTGEFSTKFGAWLYKVFNGGGDILRDIGGEYFVSQKVEYTGEDGGGAVSRTFDWGGRSTGKDLTSEARLDAFNTDMKFQEICERNGMEYVRYDNRSDAVAGMLRPASAVVLPNPIVRYANTAINSIGKSKVVNTINGAVKNNFERFVKKMPANARTNATWKSLDDGTYLFEASSAAKIYQGQKQSIKSG